MHLRLLIMATSALCVLVQPTSARSMDPQPSILTHNATSTTDNLPYRTDLRAFVSQMVIPNEQFTLSNGLKVVVVTDRATPKVAVSVWYDVGSKHEPQGQSGFAHLFEHLMFNGTENIPGDFMKPLTEAGATNLNGGTSYDFTNYHETVPTSALPRALFMESDRMGHLLGAISQDVLDEQRGVVKNEKRQGANSPLSDVNDKITQTLYPDGHPYGHSPIGSMADLDAANLADVRHWFNNHYGPNNATLVLAGDIDAATARSMVETYFGHIPAGPANVAPAVPVTSLPHRLDETTTAPIVLPVIRRVWAVPGSRSDESLALDAAAGVFSGIDDSPLYRELVRERRLFNHIIAANESKAQGGTFKIAGEVAKDVDPIAAAAALDETIARFLERGVTEDELHRWKTSFILGQARGRGSVEARAALLGISAIALGDPDAYHDDLVYLAELTPGEVIAAARTWLKRPVYALTVLPGPRVSVEMAEQITAGAAESQTSLIRSEAAEAEDRDLSVRAGRMAMPEPGEPEPVRFPNVERVRLSNGIEVSYVQWKSTPFTTVTMTFDAGSTVDPENRPGRQAMMFEAIGTGVSGRDARWIKARQERLGLIAGGGATSDEASVGMNGPTINYAAAIDLFARMVKQPTFPQDEVDRIKRQLLSAIDGESANPAALVFRTLPKMINANTPYAWGTDPESIATMTRDDLVTAHGEWVRPETAKIFVMSDLPLTELQPALEREFGEWSVAEAAGTRRTPGAPDPAPPHILLIHRPGSTQTTIYGGQRVDVADSDALVPLRLANAALGGGFQSRINQDLREQKHWAYGAHGAFDHKDLETTYNVSTNVQEDQSGPAIDVLRQITQEFLTTKPMTAAEFELARANALRALGSRFADGEDVFTTMQDNRRRGRPDDYYVHLPAIYSAMTLDQLNTAMQSTLDPSLWVWAVVGDASIVRPQLDELGLPVRVVDAASVIPKQ